MLVLWRRHTEDCPHIDEGRDYVKCRCSIWMDWRIGGKRVRKPLNTRDWTVAQIRARELEVEGFNADISPLTIKQAADKFIDDAKARGLRESSLYKYRPLFKQLEVFSQNVGLTFISQLDTDRLRPFRQTWANKNLSARKKLEHLKAFFRFCHDSNWIKSNPAKVIKAPKADVIPILPFTESEMKIILAACKTHNNPKSAVRLKALVLLMRYSGLRIGDAVTLHRDKIKNGILELYTAKSGTKVRIPLKPEVINALNRIPKTGDYFFWTGVSKRKTVSNDYETTFQSLFKRAKIAGHSHRLRHTFAVSLLQHGVSMENLSVLLGHQSIRVTERHYASWAAGRQAHLEEEIRRTW